MHADLLNLITSERARLRSVLRWELLAKLAAAAAALLWVGLLIDRQFEPPPAVRGVAYLVAAIGTLVWVGRTTLAPLFLPITNEQMAGLIERVRPEFRDSLLTAVSANAAGGGDDQVAESLMASTNERALAAASQPGRSSVVSSLRMRRWAAVATLGVGATVAYGVMNPEAAEVYANRLALSPEPWPRQVALALEGFEREEDGVWRRRIAAGDSVDLVVRADLSSGRISPRNVWLRYRMEDGQSGREAMARVGEPTDGDRPYQLFRHSLEDLRGGARMSIRGGDAAIDPVEVVLVPRPAILSVQAEITRPGYLGGAKRAAPAAAVGEIAAGSSARLTVKASRPLASVSADWQEAADSALLSVGHSPGSAEAEINCPRLDQDGLLTITIVDQYGIAGAAPYPVELRVKPDRRPTVLLRPTTPGEAVTPDARIELLAEIEDDYEVINARLTLEVDERPVAPRTLTLRAASPKRPPKRIVLRPKVDLLAQRFAGGKSAGRLAVGQVLRVAATASDGCDLKDEDRAATSPSLTFRVVTPDALLAEIEQREADLRRTFEKTTEQMSRTARGIREQAGEATARQIGRWRDAVKQSTSETLAVGEAFRGVYDRLVANRIDNSDLLDRVGRQIADPVLELGEGEMAALTALLGADPAAYRANAAAELSTSVETTMERLLAVMRSLETYNEVLAMLRQVIDGQDRVLQDTKRARRDQARSRLFD